MVLQKAPARSNVWGYSTKIGDTVQLTISNNQQFSKTVETKVVSGPEGKGTWKVTLPPISAGGPYHISVKSSLATLSITDVLFATLSITDVLFGDIWICSGQSNMQFTLSMVFNASYEIEDAKNYPDIRLFTVAMETATTPQYDFISVEEPWSVASPASAGNGNWTYFSAVCWLYGKYLYQTLKRPIGLIASDWGGTAVETWSSPDALKSCGITEEPKSISKSKRATPTAHSVLWNAMIHPMLNFTIYGAIWYQGEANAGNPLGYNCSFPAMIDDWRLKFSSASEYTTSPKFPFGFVQLAGNANDPTVSTGFPGIRWSQTASVGYVPNSRLENVFMAVAMDLPDFKSPFGSVHPRDKQTVTSRLVLSGLSVAYGYAKNFQGPFPSNIQVTNQKSTIVITFEKVQNKLEIQSNSGFEVCCSSSSDASVCDQASLTPWKPAPMSSYTANTVSLQIPSSCNGLNLLYLRYAWRESPCDYKKCAVYSGGNNLPAPPFKMPLNSVV
ncbi:hypothetical protein LOTGIDRAFT_177595 [Lottia gigantea]|uniref:Sialate O-acetylesterase domain-containing protein n=1 Tax=Lottia gigantea TaxID=225164 RepID=V3ZNW1_LOTGI|nr:hypothetical protein LOTGIDRAFT_177595 [Lottia gigantea]ESO84170.1 hypothetical protein LOTGIDRAFT_177595 [Lottia gigantea]